RCHRRCPRPPWPRLASRPGSPPWRWWPAPGGGPGKQREARQRGRRGGAWVKRFDVPRARPFPICTPLAGSDGSVPNPGGMRNRLAAVVAALVVLTGGSPVLARGGNRSLVPRPGGTRVDGRALARAAAEAGAPRFRIGFDKQLLDPDPADIAAKSIHLGGFGLFPTRASTGPMTLPDGSPEHLYVRAMAVINDRGKALLLANLENQGTFAAYKQCACGIWDARQQVALELGIPIESIVVNSDHSHGGPDLIGLWGGVPVHYLQYVHDQTVKALKAAFANAQPAYLLAGASTPTMPTPEDGG